MICIYFWGGTFGSTVEYVIRSFTNEYVPPVPFTELPNKDGSMHGFFKLNHFTSKTQLNDFLNNNNINNDTIISATYPTIEGTTLPEIARLLNPCNAKSILIYVNNDSYSELTRLFQYHKIMNGDLVSLKLAPHLFGNFSQLITQWDPQYKHVSDMQPWQLREWQSLLDYHYILDAPRQVGDNYLKVSTEEILHNTVDVFEKIINWCGLTRNSADLIKFALKWRECQQYVLDEYKLIVDIVDATINNVAKDIPEDLNIIAQSIIQRQLRKAGYELRCHGLNDFPTSTTMLHELLDSNLKLHTKDL